MPTVFRYTLQPYTGCRSRVVCPACDKPREYTRYLDTETGELLPLEYGRCNRESNCGYHASPYTPGPSGQSFAQMARFNTDGSIGVPALRLLSSPTLPPAAPVLIPNELYNASLGHYSLNNLAHLLRQHFGWGVATELITRFHLGTSAHWSGACVFWLIDEVGQVRGGQVVLYDETGHTVKSPRRCTTWVHTALTHHCWKRQQVPPTWLANYAQYGQKSPCLFGLPQLEIAPTERPVGIVESAKTAMVCTPYLPEFTWLATMGQSYLTAERLAPVKGRRVMLFPDAGSLDNWQIRAENLRNQGFNIRVATELESIVTLDEREAGLDLADVLLAEWPGYPPSWDN